MSIAVVIVVICYPLIALAVSAVPIIAGALKKKRTVKPVEYLPPEGFSPLDVMIEYYGPSAEPRGIFNPLMLYWAERGLITIEEDCKRGLKLTKLKNIEQPENCFNPKSFEIEKRIFDYIFSDSEFYTLTAGSSFIDFYKKAGEDLLKEAKKVSAKKSRKVNIIANVTAFFMFALAVITAGIAVRENYLIVMLFPFVAILMPKLVLSTSADNDGIEKGSAVRFFMFPFFLTAGGVPFTAVMVGIPGGSVSVWLPLAVNIVICVINVFFFAGKADIRTDKQLKNYAKICGFKKFLLFAEVKQLEALAEENPRYYFDILPYCYILGITEKMKTKFDRIVLDGPAWYLGELRETLMF